MTEVITIYIIIAPRFDSFRNINRYYIITYTVSDLYYCYNVYKNDINYIPSFIKCK